jgi:hypothetical protein
MLLYGPLMKRASQRVVFLAINIKTKAILGRIRVKFHFFLDYLK